MRHFLPVVVLLLAFFTSTAQSDFRSRQSGDWANSDTWEEFNGTSWQNTASVPDESAGVTTIESFMTVTVSTSVPANQVIVLEDALLDIQAGGNLILIDDTGAELDIAIGDGFSTFDGNAVVRENGILENQGEILSSAGNFSISGEYVHNRNGGVIPPAGWASGSKLKIQGVTNQAPTGFGISLSTLEWDCSGQSANVALDAPFIGVSNNLTITNTNDQRLTLNDNGTLDFILGGDFTIGNFADVVLSNSGNTTLGIAGSVINFGVLRFSVGGGTAVINARKDFNSPGDLYGTGTLGFNGSTMQLAGITGLTSGAIDYVIQDDTEVDLTTSILGGSGSFTVGNDVILYTGMADANGAFQSNTSGGSIQVAPASRSYGDNLEVIFNGSAAQYVGDAFPDGNNAMLTTKNTENVSLTDDFTATGDITLTTGSLLLNGNKLTVEHEINAGTGFHIVPDENAAIEIIGSGSFGQLPLPSGQQTIGTLAVNRSGGSATVQLTSDLIVQDFLYLTDGTLQLDNHTIEIQNLIIPDTGEIETTSASGLHISGTGAFIVIPLKNVNNDLGTFIYERPFTTYTLTANLLIHEELGLYAGTLDNSADNLTMMDGATILRRDGMLTGGRPTISGSYNLTYEGPAKTSGLELTDDTTPDLLANLDVADGPVTIEENTIVNGDVTILSGELIVDNADLTLRGAGWTNNSGDFTQKEGTLFIESIISIEGTGTEQFDNVRIPNGYMLNIEEMAVGGNLIIEPGGLLDLSGELLLNGTGTQQINVQSTEVHAVTINKASGEVYINEPLRLTGKFLFETATNVNSNGNLIIATDTNDPFGGGYVDVIPAGAGFTGNVVSEWYQEDAEPTGTPMYFGSTVTGATIAGLQDDIIVTGSFTGADTGPVDPSLFYYDETTAGTIGSGWTAYPSTDDQALLETGTGYLAYVMDNSPVTLDLTGQLNQGDVSIPVTYTDSAVPSSDGWNLVANPFASSIGWDQLNGWDKSNVRGVIAVNRNGKFYYYNSTGAGQASSLVMENGLIAKHEAFWVQAVSSGDLIIGEQTKVQSADLTPPTSPANQMLLTLNDGTNTDQALLVVAPGASADYDAGMDAPKFDNAGMDISTISADGTPLAMNFLAPLGCGESIEVRIADTPSGDYTLSVNTVELFDIPYRVTLYDAFLDISHNVNNQPNYSFTIDENDLTTFEGRFTIEFEADLEDLVNQDLSYTADGTICPGTTGTVTFASSQSGVSYQLEINGSAYGNPQTGTGATLFFDLDPEDLEVSNTLKVLASPAECATPVYLTEEKTILKSDLDPEIVYAGGKLVSNYTAGNTWYFGDVSNQISTANEITPSEEGTYILQVNSGGCSQSVTYEFVVTSVDADIDGEISVFPNPAAGNYLNVYMDNWDGNEAVIEVMGVNGQFIDSKMTSNGSLRIDISRYVRGVYLLRIQTSEKLITRRFIRK